MSRATNAQQFKRHPARTAGSPAENEAEARHDDLQRHLAHAPEGTEPPLRVQRLTWTVFATTAAAALIILVVVLGMTWGWGFAVVGVALVLAMYCLTFWPDYAAWGLRAKDKREADRKIDAGIPPPESPDRMS